MKIINVKDVEAKEVQKNPLFLGGKVHTQFVLEEELKAKKIQVSMVKFAAGARNKLHTHTTDQILIVTEGKGIVATKDQEHIVTPGMVIYIPPGEEHWHGATKDSPFAHLSILGQPHEEKILEK
ncbi:MAG: cupin domain-containing protein [Nitrososphaeria archaeon]|jgi:quercetin dioxygenase-like cupin family protein